MAKENFETRVTLAILRAMPPLVGMPDFEVVHSKTSEFNLKIGKICWSKISALYLKSPPYKKRWVDPSLIII